MTESKVLKKSSGVTQLQSATDPRHQEEENRQKVPGLPATLAYSRAEATKTLGFLRRNKETKLSAYKALVRPQLKYAAPIWNPHHQTDINRIEKVQRTAACWTCRRWRN